MKHNVNPYIIERPEPEPERHGSLEALHFR